MTDSKRLIEGERIRHLNLNEDIPTITLQTGIGKTYCAVHHLASLIQENSNRKINETWLLLPTKALKEQTLHSYGIDVEPLEEIDMIEGAMNYAGKGKVKVACFSYVASFLAENKNTMRLPDLVVIDEADELVSWSVCHDNNMVAWDYLNRNKDKSVLVAMTATPQLLTRYIAKYTKYNFVDITPHSPFKLRVNQITVVKHSSIDSYIKYLKHIPHKKVLCYVRSAKKCIELSNRLNSEGYRTAFLVSQYNEKIVKDINGEPIAINELMRKQLFRDDETELELFDFISKHKKLPDEVDILFINDAVVAGVNIEDEAVDTVVADTAELAVSIQARGRIRHNIENFVIVFNFKEKQKYQEIKAKLIDIKKENNYAVELKAQEKTIEAIEDKSKITLYMFRDYAGNPQINPFIESICQYQEDIYSLLNNYKKLEWYFEPLNRMTDNPIKYYYGEDVKQATHNIEALDSFNITPYLNRKLFKEDKNKLIEEINLQRTARHKAKWNSVKAILELEGYEVKDSMTRREGKNLRYSTIRG